MGLSENPKATEMNDAVDEAVGAKLYVTHFIV